MIPRLFFTLRYAMRSIWRSRRWSGFAMLSVAAGVATVVALRSLGLAIGDSLTSNVRSVNHGDITIAKGSANPFTRGLGQEGANAAFTGDEQQIIAQWAANNDALLSAYTTTTLQVVGADQTSAGLFDLVTTLFIDPATYPPTQDIVAQEPRNASLETLLTGPVTAVISENLAENQNLAIGDSIRVSGSDETFLVTGIVPTEAEAGLRDPFAAFFGFVYFHQSQKERLGINPNPNTVSLLLPDSLSLEEIDDAARDLNAVLRRFSGFHRIRSVPRLLEVNETIADTTGRFIVIMGLGAMLLGGVGIINTMLVLVRRRTNEIAAMKTFGVNGRQVATLFMTESLLLGIFGSLIGMVVGALISTLTITYGETFVLTTLEWRLYPEALAFGLTLGVLVTAVFGVLPVLVAVQVRPGIILRPNQTYIPVLGVVQSLLVLAFVVIALGLIAGHIIGAPTGELDPFAVFNLPSHYLVGVVMVAATFLILGILVVLLWLLVWFIGKLPALGLVDLRLALSNLSTQRMRTAITLLAIGTGMFALSSITFYGTGMREILRQTLIGSIGGNVLILSPASVSNIPAVANLDQQRIDNKLDELDGVLYRTRMAMYDGRVTAVDGRAPEANNPWVNLSVHDTDNPAVTGRKVIAGRALTPADRGQRLAVVKLTPFMIEAGVEVGSILYIRTGNGGEPLALEVVGLAEDAIEDVQSLVFFGDVHVPPDTLQSSFPFATLNAIMVEPQQMDAVLQELSSMIGVFPLDITFLDRVLSRLIDQFSALPLLVGLLSMGAAAVIMGNTVSLATLERRRQIGILKAIGLGSSRVLGIMLIENVLISLLGAVLGIMLSALGVVVMSYVGLGQVIVLPADARPVAAVLIGLAVLIGSAATILNATVAVRERVLNVLRYE